MKSVILLSSKLEIPLYIQIFDISKYFDKENLKDAMDTLHKCRITGKLYRLWYEMYRDSLIRVKTAAESIGGAILSSASLDNTLRTYLKDSDSEISYGNLQLSIFALQDDALRITDGFQKVQTGTYV